LNGNSKYLIGMDHDSWNIAFPLYCKRVSDEIPDADGLELNFEHPDLFKLFPSYDIVSYINETISSYNFNSISIHSLTRDINISSYNPRIREISFKELTRAIELFSKLDSAQLLYFLVHGGQNSFRAPSQFSKNNLHFSLSVHIDNLIKLKKICDDYGIILTIENLIYSSWRLSSKIEYLESLFAEIPDLKFTFDIDHASFVSYSYARKMLQKFIDKVNVVHVGIINYFHKFKNLLSSIKPHFVFEPHSIKNKIHLFQNLNKNVKTVKRSFINNNCPEIAFSEQKIIKKPDI